MATLYKRDQKGALRFWSINSNDDSEIEIEFGQVGGEVQYQNELVESNEFRDAPEQVESRIRSRINAKLDHGYVYDKNEAMTKNNKNLLGYARPMLAAKFSTIKTEIDYENSIFQYKYDGHRCMITNDSGTLVAYSRGGKPITTIGHILKDIQIPEGVTLDGELYCHGQKLQTISSWVKRFQPNTLNIKYHCYDVVNGLQYEERRRMMDTYDYGDNAYPVPSLQFKGSVACMLSESINKGYEGLIIRTPEFGYEDGKRSKGLIKVKQWLDDEFRVVGIEESKDGWAKLRCVMPDGKKFGVSAPGTIGFKTYVLNNPKMFIGKYLKVEYSGFTMDGIPFHPVAIMFRDAEAE